MALESMQRPCSTSSSAIGTLRAHTLGCRQAAPHIHHHARSSLHHASTRCQAVPGTKLYIDPTLETVSAFAPATVANLGPGFDWLGCAVEVRTPACLWMRGA